MTENPKGNCHVLKSRFYNPVVRRFPWLVVVAAILDGGSAGARQDRPALPAGPLAFGAFTSEFKTDGTFLITGQGWPKLEGTWKTSGANLELQLEPAPRGCEGPGRYTFVVSSGHLSLSVVTDDCQPRRMILDRSSWRPSTERVVVPERRIVRTATDRLPALPAAVNSSANWPSFRGVNASGVADGQKLPDHWDVTNGTNVLWRASIPGLAHSSPIVWGDRVFVATAVSQDPKATFKPGLYGDGDASEDQSPQRWMVEAIDKLTGRVIWQRVAFEGVPKNKRHMKSTYASATPATDGRVVVAWFGSQGVVAYDMNGFLRWKVDLGRVDMGAYDVPTYEWGPASSPILWNGLVILQCDTQADSFLLALKADTGETVWKTPREELPSWGTPTVVSTSAGPELVTNAANFIRGYDPKTGVERWRLGKSSKITAPTPIAADDLIVVASGRGPERPIFVIKPGAHGDITPRDGETTSTGVVWSKTARGPYMPTPLAYRGQLYVLGNNGVFDAYELKTGTEIYRQRMPQVGNGFSASPIAADGKIYVSSEDGDISVLTAGRDFTPIATNALGELIMATPALSDGVMYVRTEHTLFAIGKK